MSTTPNRTTTSRGFAIYDEFVDLYGHKVRVQKSSYAAEPAVWIFAEEGPCEVDPASPHLTVEQAKRVRDALDAFISEEEHKGNG